MPLNNVMHILDSHVHLFSEESLDTLSWMTDDNVLASNHTINEYFKSINEFPSKYHFDGLVFIEADVKSHTNNEEGWDFPIEESTFAILQNYDKINGGLIKAVIPWVPLIQGRDSVIRYVLKLKNSVGEENFGLIKGFRYLVQDKPDGTMMDDNFIEALNWISSQGFLFDLGIDINRRGFLQFEEFEFLLERTSNVTFINNHLAKPRLSIPYETIHNNDFFNNWKKHMLITSELCRKTGNKIYIKVSGVFSELDDEACQNEERALEFVFPWIKFIFDNWDPQYIIWGSDWPVCNIRAGVSSIVTWLKITERILERLELSEKQKEHFFSKGAIAAYNI